MKFHLKKIIFSLTLLLFVISSFGQTTTNPEFSKDYYLKKSKNEKITAKILLGGGTALVIGGFVIASHDIFGTAGDIGGGILLGGIVADIVSIPFFSSAHKHKKLAANVAINNQKILLPQKNSIGFVTQPAITIKIGL